MMLALLCQPTAVCWGQPHLQGSSSNQTSPIESKNKNNSNKGSEEEQGRSQQTSLWGGLFEGRRSKRCKQRAPATKEFAVLSVNGHWLRVKDRSGDETTFVYYIANANQNKYLTYSTSTSHGRAGQLRC